MINICLLHQIGRIIELEFLDQRLLNFSEVFANLLSITYAKELGFLVFLEQGLVLGRLL